MDRIWELSSLDKNQSELFLIPVQNSWQQLVTFVLITKLGISLLKLIHSLPITNLIGKDDAILWAMIPNFSLNHFKTRIYKRKNYNMEQHKPKDFL